MMFVEAEIKYRRGNESETTGSVNPIVYHYNHLNPTLKRMILKEIIRSYNENRAKAKKLLEKRGLCDVQKLAPKCRDTRFIQFNVFGPKRMNTILMKRTQPLIKAMKVFSSRCGVAREKFRFNYKGRRVDDSDTPAALSMSNGETIYAMDVESSYLVFHID